MEIKTTCQMKESFREYSTCLLIRCPNRSFISPVLGTIPDKLLQPFTAEKWTHLKLCFRREQLSNRECFYLKNASQTCLEFFGRFVRTSADKRSKTGHGHVSRISHLPKAVLNVINVFCRNSNSRKLRHELPRLS